MLLIVIKQSKKSRLLLRLLVHQEENNIIFPTDMAFSFIIFLHVLLVLFYHCVYGCKIKIHRTIILSVVLYGCETWSLTLRDERRLMVFENRVLGRVFGPKMDEITGEWGKLHNEELSDLYSLPNIVWVVKSRRMR